MDKKTIICLVLFVGLVLFSCHPRHATDVRLGMTKDDVIALWGPTPLITYKTVNRTTYETWEYHFATSGSVCWVTFVQDRVAAPLQCRQPAPAGWYY